MKTRKRAVDVGCNEKTADLHSENRWFTSKKRLLYNLDAHFVDEKQLPIRAGWQSFGITTPTPTSPPFPAHRN